MDHLRKTPAEHQAGRRWEMTEDKITLREEVMFCMGILAGFVLCLVILKCLLLFIPGSVL